MTTTRNQPQNPLIDKFLEADIGFFFLMFLLRLVKSKHALHARFDFATTTGFESHMEKLISLIPLLVTHVFLCE